MLTEMCLHPHSMLVIAVTLLILLDSPDVYVTGHAVVIPVGPHRSPQNAPPGAPENQNLDPNDKTPGTLILPENYKDYDTPLPAKVEPWDLSDDEINVHQYYYRNNPNYFLWNKPPCEWYNEGSDSVKNEGRSVGCDHIMSRLLKDQRKEAKKHQPPSVNCSNVVSSTCFRFHGHRGRCYMEVQTSVDPAPSKYKYVLINYCD